MDYKLGKITLGTESNDIASFETCLKLFKQLGLNFTYFQKEHTGYIVVCIMSKQNDISMHWLKENLSKITARYQVEINYNFLHNLDIK